ncbi:hypothetical protein E2C01_062686 [Portunus trituberculatus]|uniref:Uncharacterized protein n=1 Tax=Portunus trituberculatus TaxID=210409 RepID=A0A5B7HIQ8_PORTR|nr:hypothetical protein [Portunus trituberculatus]
MRSVPRAAAACHAATPSRLSEPRRARDDKLCELARSEDSWESLRKELAASGAQQETT